MRAYRFDRLDGLDHLTLHDEPAPQPQRGEVLVKVHAVSLNYRDIAVPLGRYVWDAKPGLVPCSDAAGEIVAVGQGVGAFKPGDRVVSLFHPRWFGGRPPLTTAADTYGSGQDGWLAEYKVVSQEAVVRLPDGPSYEEGSTLPCAGVTAWNALSGPVPVRAGSTVLTLGSGGVSVFAIQLAKALGATVIATTSSDRKGEALKGLGADAVVNYREIERWGRHVKTALTGGVGVDRVVEVAGPATVNQALDAVRWGGEVVLIGFLSDTGPAMDYLHLKGSGAVIRSIGVGDRAMLEDLIRAVTAARIRPVIDRVFDFGDARAAFGHLASGSHIGKVVVRLGARS
jgi:NADPH:quinone reductase-like Zn-dependent oxidoreductase